MSIRDDLNGIKQAGRPVIGCFPLYPPLELFDAMGLSPVILWGFSDDGDRTPRSDRHLQDYTCSVARRLTEFVLSDAGRELDGLFMYNACDTLRNLPEILEDATRAAGRPIPVHRLHLPVTAPEPGIDISGYLDEELKSLVRDLEKRYGVAFSGQAFAESTRRHEQIRQLCRTLEDFVAEGRLPFADFVRTVHRAGWLPTEARVPLLSAAIERAGRAPQQPVAARGRVLLSGILPPPPEICDAIESAGLRVTGNDIASLYRSYAETPPPDEDPGRYYHFVYRDHFPCPTLLGTADRRCGELIRRVRERRADAVIFVGEKFCEYEYFEFPYLEKQLNAEGVRTLRLEIAMGDASAAAHRTRIEALAEMLPGRD